MDYSQKEIKRGLIIYVKFSETTQGTSLQGKARPAIVVSNDKINAYSTCYTVIPLSTQEKRMHLPTHCVITSAPCRSVAYYEQVTTISRSQVSGIIGKISDEEMSEVEKGIKAQFAL